MQIQALKRSNSSSCLLDFCRSSWSLPVDPRRPSFAWALLSLRAAYYQKSMSEEPSIKVRTMGDRTYQSVYEHHEGSGGVSLLHRVRIAYQISMSFFAEVSQTNHVDKHTFLGFGCWSPLPLFCPPSPAELSVLSALAYGRYYYCVLWKEVRLLSAAVDGYSRGRLRRYNVTEPKEVKPERSSRWKTSTYKQAFIMDLVRLLAIKKRGFAEDESATFRGSWTRS